MWDVVRTEIKDNEGDTVAQGCGESVMHDHSRIANMIDFDNCWNEDMVREK